MQTILVRNETKNDYIKTLIKTKRSYEMYSIKEYDFMTLRKKPRYYYL